MMNGSMTIDTATAHPSISEISEMTSGISRRHEDLVNIIAVKVRGVCNPSPRRVLRPIDTVFNAHDIRTILPNPALPGPTLGTKMNTWMTMRLLVSGAAPDSAVKGQLQ